MYKRTKSPRWNNVFSEIDAVPQCMVLCTTESQIFRINKKTCEDICPRTFPPRRSFTIFTIQKIQEHISLFCVFNGLLKFVLQYPVESPRWSLKSVRPSFEAKGRSLQASLSDSGNYTCSVPGKPPFTDSQLWPMQCLRIRIFFSQLGDHRQ